MSNLKDKKILLAVTGSIAAYKSLLLTRLLIKQGAQVQILMTPTATRFVSALSFATLSKNPVHTSVVDGDSWNNHVEMGLWADVLLVAPCTATSLAKMANGIADTIVTAVYLSAKCPVLIAPAMDRDMWLHPSTKKNIETLQSYGNGIIPVGSGELASGLHGEGRMAEPEDIIKFLGTHFKKKTDLANKTVLITAGPTYEAIDPVRFIGNHSSGKMGMALAEECAERGAKVELVLGPSQLKTQQSGIEVHRVTSAAQMLEKAESLYDAADVAIFAAAVADYRPKNAADEKIKKNDAELALSLEKTEDIAKTLGKKKRKTQINIGFALETTNELEYAKAKLQKKNFDFIVLNSLRDKGAGFKHDTNKIRIVGIGENVQEYPLKSKKDVAGDIVDNLVSLF